MKHTFWILMSPKGHGLADKNGVPRLFHYRKDAEKANRTGIYSPVKVQIIPCQMTIQCHVEE